MKLKKFLSYFGIFICSAGLSISGIQIYKWFVDNNKTAEEIEEVQIDADITEVDGGEETKHKQKIDKSNPYWDFIKMKLIDVDLDKLRQTNPDTKGWIQVAGTNINYPFVQANDNDYYLNHTFDKSYNNAGWVYMDYRNDTTLSQQNNILYAHGRVDTTMFGSLRHILTNGWLNDDRNAVIKTVSDNGSGIWQVFSVYRIPVTNDYLKIQFPSEKKFLEFGQMLKKRSAKDFGIDVEANDKIITLSTCYNDKERVVMHAKLIKFNER